MTRPTKNDMARVIVAALYNMKSLPAADHHKVVRWSRMRAAELRDHHKRALAAIESVRTFGKCPKCGDESLPFKATGVRNALCDECLGVHLDMSE